MSQADCAHYLDLVRHNHRCALLLAEAARGHKTSPDVSDWIVTFHFYILCVYVKALGRCRLQDFQDHYSLRAWLNQQPDLLEVTKSYRRVEEWSRDARYEGRTFTGAEMERLHRWFVHARDGFADLLEAENVRPVPRPAAIEP